MACWSMAAGDRARPSESLGFSFATLRYLVRLLDASARTELYARQGCVANLFIFSILAAKRWRALSGNTRGVAPPARD